MTVTAEVVAEVVAGVASEPDVPDGACVTEESGDGTDVSETDSTAPDPHAAMTMAPTKTPRNKLLCFTRSK